MGILNIEYCYADRGNAFERPAKDFGLTRRCLCEILPRIESDDRARENEARDVDGRCET